MYCERDCNLCSTKDKNGLTITNEVYEFLKSKNFNLNVKLSSNYDCYYGAPNNIISDLNSLVNEANKKKLFKFKCDCDRVCVNYNGEFFLLCVDCSENNVSCNISLIKQ